MAYVLTFIPIFVAVDVLGIIPIFLSLVEPLESSERRRVISQSVLTASVVGLGFMFLGKAVFLIIGLLVADFKIAGGLVLLVLSLIDLLSPEKSRRQPTTSMGVVPLGTPLIVGPAVLTTIIMLIDIYGIVPTITSFIANMIIVWFAFVNSDYIIKILGDAGSKAISKVASLILASIGVMMVRRGIMDIIALEVR
ncbi:MarC family protein [bacterium]|nr:MarC family protein [bacterium]NIN92006.1 MarC family protein [bacterium]NIO18222.1 MarC family protein [bacterium]NIO73196.1 MarC family protein [bacterium]